MKFRTLSFALLSISGYVCFGSTFDDNVFRLTTDYHTPKNIMFSGPCGGSSHVVWVLSILEELTSRGHHAIFYTRGDHVKFLKDYPSVDLITSQTPPISERQMDIIVRKMIDEEPINKIQYFRRVFNKNYTSEYLAHRDLFTSENIDLVLCDQFFTPCMDAALTAKIPMVATSSFIGGPDGTKPYINTDVLSFHNPTSKDVPFFTRIKEKIIDPIRLILKTRSSVREIYREQARLGVQPAIDVYERCVDSIKLRNNAFGFTPPRPLGPLYELVGPIMRNDYPGMTDTVQQFLDHHQKVVYVAFGQNAVPIAEEVEFVMRSLLENKEEGDIDGILWATRGIEDLFPETITTRSGKVYQVGSMIEKTPSGDLAFLSWAPQVAILHHPSTVLFLTHGGFGSVYESLYQGVPMVVYPFFGDQHGSAKDAESNGYGRWMRKDQGIKAAIEVVREVLQDKDGKYKQNVDRFKALVQIRSTNGVKRGADVVEEALFMHKEGKMVHRRDVRRDISFLKAHNLDIYLFSVASVIAFFFAVHHLLAFGLGKVLLKKSKLA